MKKWYTVAIVLGFVLLGLIFFSQRQTGLVVNTELVVSNGHTDVNAIEAKELIDANPDLIILDVSPFYEEGHLPGATWANYGDGALGRMIPYFDPDATYLVYCHLDESSLKSVKKLKDAGFENVYRLRDHYTGWVDAGYSVEK